MLGPEAYVTDMLGGSEVAHDDHAEETVQLLNADLFGEHDAILYYLTHAWTIARRHGPQILEIANDEMRHFKWLAHTIVALGGTPDLRTPSVTPTEDLAGALKKDVEAERHAIDQYEEHEDRIRQDRVRSLLRRIVADEQDHLRQFQELLNQTHGEPDRTPRAPQETEGIADRLKAAIHAEYQQTLAYLLRSFLEDHGRQVGLDMEERSVDEMRHMGWMGRRIGALGMMPTFERVRGWNTVSGEEEEAELYRDVRTWAQEAAPNLLPMIDRIQAHERYHAETPVKDPSKAPV